MGLKKNTRERVHQKYDGKCAYCGSDIEYKDMQVDHIHPKYRGGKDDFDNLNPSCRPCNGFKLTFSIEEFREELRLQVERARRYSQNFRRAERYGLIVETNKPVIFYFETVK